MRLYQRVEEGTFLSRPNRFIAMVDIGGRTVRCHVKNTGRCRELLVPGTKVFLSVSDSPGRSTTHDLVAVMKGGLLVNMDSQAPNAVAAEGLRLIPGFADVTEIRREFSYGDSRIDLMATAPGRRILIEVKGVTLEEGGICMFPDAPTERGRKHIGELMHAAKDGWEACILFVVQMEGMRRFEPNRITDPAFAEALSEAAAEGVRIIAYGCDVEPDSMTLSYSIPVSL